MNRFIRHSDWRPMGIDDLEPEADEALRSEGNVSVIAGPGAGKTELLAQRACYLLQTGVCAPPFSILAISYKRDSARNLQQRVGLRCGPVLSRRFRSMTFDAFAKSLVDRFLPAIPPAWRPSRGYTIENISEAACKEFLRALRPPDGVANPRAIHEIREAEFLRDCFYGSPLDQAVSRAPMLSSGRRRNSGITGSTGCDLLASHSPCSGGSPN
ncbi:UvrD-helicase domain-containing protein [Tautonia sociabilis]|uniref:ATP-dependent helicase n=1 Tax=Tautonia sociabilis TaxID=2080755 RepID=A0A432MEN9_9BACT|nr:UvrD-helicase domain-containing protein [Tautonia sociabilis]RUL84022.1 ATP-dependent helicase [Tautonia sociabilis]